MACWALSFCLSQVWNETSIASRFRLLELWCPKPLRSFVWLSLSITRPIQPLSAESGVLDQGKHQTCPVAFLAVWGPATSHINVCHIDWESPGITVCVLCWNQESSIDISSMYKHTRTKKHSSRASGQHAGQGLSAPAEVQTRPMFFSWNREN